MDIYPRTSVLQAVPACGASAPAATAAPEITVAPAPATTIAPAPATSTAAAVTEQPFTAAEGSHYQVFRQAELQKIKNPGSRLKQGKRSNYEKVFLLLSFLLF